VPDDVMESLRRHGWTGNVRELQNVIERAVILSRDGELRIPSGCLTSAASSHAPSPGRRLADDGGTLPAKMTRILQDREKEIIESALAESRGKIARKGGAAARLGIPPSTLDSKIKQLGIKKDNSGQLSKWQRVRAGKSGGEEVQVLRGAGRFAQR